MRTVSSFDLTVLVVVVFRIISYHMTFHHIIHIIKCYIITYIIQFRIIIYHIISYHTYEKHCISYLKVQHHARPHLPLTDAILSIFPSILLLLLLLEMPPSSANTWRAQVAARPRPRLARALSFSLPFKLKYPENSPRVFFSMGLPSSY